MSVWSVVSLALGLQISGAVDTQVGVAETPGGGQQNRVAATASVDPSATFSAGGQFTGLLASYAPRAFWRYPARQEPIRPAILHRLTLAYSDPRPGRARLSMLNSVTLGQVDYNSVPQVIGTDQAGAPPQQFVDILTANLALSYSYALTRRLSLGLGVPILHQSSLNASSSSLGTTTSIGLQPSVAYALTRRDTVTLGGGPRVVLFERSTSVEQRATLGWVRQINERWQSQFSAGGGRNQVIDADPLPNAAIQLSVRPFYFAIGTAGLSRSAQSGSESVQLSLDARTDPFLQIIRPQASLSLSATRTLYPRVTLTVSGNGSTVTARDPVAGDPNETTVQTSVTLNWQLSDVGLRLGGNWFGRGPHLARGFDLRERAFSANIGANWTVF